MNLRIYIIAIFIFSFSLLKGQTSNGVGSYESENGFYSISENTYKDIFSEVFYIGPNAILKIDGQLNIYAKRIWIAPTAKISGSGSIHIHNPGDNPFYEDWASDVTQIDGNDGNFIDVNIVLLNNHGLQLTNINVAEFVGATSTSKEKLAALKLSKSIDLRVDGAHVFLNSFDFELSTTGDILSYSSKRHIVTGNSVLGHLIKNFSPTISTYTFPVGKEKEDYTPARLKPSINTSKVYVSVTDYLASGLQFKDETIGMDRVWNIYADRAQKMDYTLIHNVATNGIAYVDESAQIVQNTDGGNWIGNISQLDGAGVLTRKDVETRASKTLSGTWFTKFSNKPPKAIDDKVNLEYGSSITIEVLENDIPGSAAIIRSSVEIVNNPIHGTVTIVNGSFVYTPNPGYVGEDVFEYKITDENGLTSIAKVFITVFPRELLIPNVITPNGDGKNDNFVIIGREAYESIDLTVINRWGNEVFRDKDYKDNWSGIGLNEGTYFYIIEAQGKDAKRVFKGNVLIKRN